MLLYRDPDVKRLVSFGPFTLVLKAKSTQYLFDTLKSVGYVNTIKDIRDFISRRASVNSLN